MSEQTNSVIFDGSAAPRRQKHTGWVVAALVAALALIAWWLWPRHKAETEAEPQPTVSVQVAKAERQTITAEASALGTIAPRQQATVSAKLSSQIRRMALLKNRAVRSGEVIAVLEARDLQAQRAEAVQALQEARLTAKAVATGTIPQARAQEEKALQDARANVATASAQYQRRQTLRAQGGLAEKDLEAARLALTLAEGELRLAEANARVRAATNPNDLALANTRIEQAEQRVATLDAQLSYATIRAPFSGVITDQFAYEGEFITPGAKLVNLGDLSEVIIKTPFADTVAAELKVGDEAEVAPTDLPGEHLTGRVSLISRASDPANRTVEVWVNLPNRSGRLRAGGTAQVTVATKTTSASIVVAAAAVTFDATNANAGTVIVVDDKQVAHETKVTTGIRTPEQIEIKSGLKGGESVVVEGNYALPDGAKVQVEEGEKEGGKDGEKASGKDGEKEGDEEKGKQADKEKEGAAKDKGEGKKGAEQE